MTITQAKSSDAQELFALESESFLEQDYRLSLASFYYHIKKNLLYVVKIDTKIVGYALVLSRKKHNRLYSLAVSHSFQKKGIGAALLEHIQKQCCKKPLELEVKQSNTKAITLYNKFGFEIVKELPFYYHDSDGYRMIKF